MMKSKVFITSFLAISLLFSISLFAQEKAALTSSDKKKLSKADQESEKAAAKYKEADKIYMDVSARQSELTAEESDKLNNKAIVKQIESIKIEYGARKMRYDVYAPRVELFWVQNSMYIDKMGYARSLDNNAKNDFSTAEELYKEHEKIDDNLMKLSKLSDANENMGKAVDKMKEAFEICANPVITENETPPPAETSTAPVETTAVEPVPVAPPVENIEPTQAPAPIPSENAPTPLIEEKPANDQVVVTPAPISEPTPAPAETTPAASVIVPESTPAQEPKMERQHAPEGTYYRVQIAASRVPLNTEQLAEIYNGSETPQESLINEWYKYTIGTFQDYDSAVSLKDQCGVKGAFVVQR